MYMVPRLQCHSHVMDTKTFHGLPVKANVWGIERVWLAGVQLHI